MYRLSKPGRASIALLASGLLVFCSFLSLVVLPTWQSYLDQRQLLDNLILSQSTRKWHENYLALKEEKDAKANYLRSLVSKLFYEDEIHRQVGMIHQLSLRAGTELLRFQPGPVLSAEPYLAQNVQVFIKGSYEETICFLQLIRDLKLYQQLRFAIQPYEGQLQSVLDLHFYYQHGKRGG